MDVTKGYPTIELEYIARENPLESVPYLYAAAETYVQSRHSEEKAYVRVESYGTKASVKVGRKVLGTISYAEIVENAEEMHREIDASEVLRGNDISAAEIFVGYQLSGNLPDQE